MKFLEWLQNLGVSQWVLMSDLGYPILLSIHSIGMAAVVGLLVVLDLRVLGLFRGIPLDALRKYMVVAWAGFGLNLVSGTLLFMSDAKLMIANWPFQLKISLIVIGGLLTWMLWRALRFGGSVMMADRSGAGLIASEFQVSRRAKTIAAASLVVWFSAIVMGRLIGYYIGLARLGAS